MKFKKTFIRLLISFIVIIVVVGFSFYEIIQSGEDSMKVVDKDSVTFTNQLPKNYIHFFKNKDLHLEGSRYSKTRNPISVFNYKGDYNVVLYELSIPCERPLNKIIKEEFTSEFQTSSVSYYKLLNESGTQSNLYNILYKVGAPAESKDIYLTLSGYNTNIIEKNDTVACYYSQMNNFSIRYSKDEDQDFYGEVKDDSLMYKLPFEMMFLKRNSYIYLIIMTVENNKATLNKSILYSLMIKK